MGSVRLAGTQTLRAMANAILNVDFILMLLIMALIKCYNKQIEYILH